MGIDPLGLLPPVIRQNYERDSLIDRHLSSARGIGRALKALDPRLGVVYITDSAPADNGVVPGRWHVRVQNKPPAPDSYIPITTESGGYREPDSGVIHEMQRRDLQTHGIPKLERTESPKPDYTEEIAADVRAAWRVPGEGGMKRRLWGKK